MGPHKKTWVKPAQLGSDLPEWSPAPGYPRRPDGGDLEGSPDPWDIDFPQVLEEDYSRSSHRGGDLPFKAGSLIEPMGGSGFLGPDI